MSDAKLFSVDVARFLSSVIGVCFEKVAASGWPDLNVLDSIGGWTHSFESVSSTRWDIKN